jgi:hypothetical protein
MTDQNFWLDRVEAELSQLVDHDVELLGRPTSTGQTLYLVMPKDRSRLQARFWRAVQSSDSMGIWSSPEAAVVAFAAGVHAWRAARSPMDGGDIESALTKRLELGPVAAADVLGEFAGMGVSVHRVGRIARRIGVIRRKSGMRGGWTWFQPEGGVPTSVRQSVG